MHAQKLSISLPQQKCDLIESYQAADLEIDDAFEITTSDGIEKDEAW